MMKVEAGWKVTQVSKLPAPVTDYLLQDRDKHYADADFIDGGILHNSKLAWLSGGSKFTVVSLSTGQKIASWTFGAVLRETRARVSCVCEIGAEDGEKEKGAQLLVGLECELGGGAVCLFHCNGSAVARAVRLDCRVSSLTYVPRFRGPLGCFDGAVVVGTHGGIVFVFDLDREIRRREVELARRGDSHSIRDETNPAELVILPLDEVELLEDQRSIAREREEHIGVHLNEGCVRRTEFVLRDPDGAIRAEVPRERVFVTNVIHAEQISSVVVAFSVGAFQIWNAKTLTLDYTSHLYREGLAVNHMGFMEPCDDPRAFCYLWVVYSPSVRHSEAFPLAAMYALTYREKKTSDCGRVLYEELLTCMLRFNIELNALGDGDAGGKRPSVGGRSVACRTISRTIRDDDADERTLNICQIVWEYWSASVISPVNSAMLIFDIDQWYKEQMPDCSLLETNNYMSVVNVSEGLSGSVARNVCDIKIDPCSLSPYTAVQRLEEHFYPNALSYECVCLSDCDIIRFTATSVQNEILQNIAKSGPSILLHPAKLFQQCVVSGLLPLYGDVNYAPEVTNAQQRQLILSVALEASMVRFLLKCGTDWMNDSFASSECSLKFLIEWCWSRCMILKINGDQLVTPLFDHSGENLDANASRFFNSCTIQLSDIDKLLSSILDKCSQFTLPNVVNEIKQRQKAIKMVALHFQVIQWFLDVGLLPELDTEMNTLEKNDRLPYPLDSLINFYQNRRLKLHRLNGNTNPDTEVQNTLCESLFIDRFIETECGNELLRNMWKEENSTLNGLYPPPSLHALLKIYLIPNVSEESKHSLVLYMLIDYAMMFYDAWYEIIIRRLMQFPTVFGLKNSTIKVTQAFWHLDHKDFEFASAQLHHVLANGCLVQWHHEVVLSAFSLQKKIQLALQYLHVRKTTISNRFDSCKDWEVCCNLYLSRDLILQAYELIKSTFNQSTSAEDRKERLTTFFEACRKQGSLPKVFVLPFNQEEEDIFTKYLINIGDVDSCNLLIAYYLERSRYIEAKQINEDLKLLTNKGQLPYDLTDDEFAMKKQHTHKTKARDQLVNIYCKMLPKITMQLTQVATSRNEKRQTTMPTPLTVNVLQTKTNTISYKSSIIQQTIDKVNETWTEKSPMLKNIKRALQVEHTPFLCTPKLSKIHHRRYEDFEMINLSEDEHQEPADKDIPTAETIETISPRLQQEMKLLLHTPIVEKKTNWPSDVSTGQLSVVSSRLSLRTATPQSILKVKKLLSNVDEHHLAETDDELLETMSQHTQSDMSRSIRFNLPTASNSSSPSNPDTLDDLFDFEIKKSPLYKNYSGASPRKGIHESCSNQMHSQKSSSPPSSESTPTKKRKIEHLSSSIPMDIHKDTTKEIHTAMSSPKSRLSYNLRHSSPLSSPKLQSSSTPIAADTPKSLSMSKAKCSLTRRILETSVLTKINQTSTVVPVNEENISGSILTSDNSEVVECTASEKVSQFVTETSMEFDNEIIDDNQSEVSSASTPSLAIDEGKDDIEIPSAPITIPPQEQSSLMTEEESILEDSKRINASSVTISEYVHPSSSGLDIESNNPADIVIESNIEEFQTDTNDNVESDVHTNITEEEAEFQLDDFIKFGEKKVDINVDEIETENENIASEEQQVDTFACEEVYPEIENTDSNQFEMEEFIEFKEKPTSEDDNYSKSVENDESMRLQIEISPSSTEIDPLTQTNMIEIDQESNIIPMEVVNEEYLEITADIEPTENYTVDSVELQIPEKQLTEFGESSETVCAIESNNINLITELPSTEEITIESTQISSNLNEEIKEKDVTTNEEISTEEIIHEKDSMMEIEKVISSSVMEPQQDATPVERNIESFDKDSIGTSSLIEDSQETTDSIDLSQQTVIISKAITTPIENIKDSPEKVIIEQIKIVDESKDNIVQTIINQETIAIEKDEISIPTEEQENINSTNLNQQATMIEKNIASTSTDIQTEEPIEEVEMESTDVENQTITSNKKRAATLTRSTRVNMDSIEAIQDLHSDTNQPESKTRAVAPTGVTRASIDSIEAIKEPSGDIIPVHMPKKRAATPTRVTRASVDSIEAIKEPTGDTIPVDVPKKRATTPTRVTRASVDSIEAIKEPTIDTVPLDVPKKRAGTPTRVSRASVDSIEAIKEPIINTIPLDVPKKRAGTPTRVTRASVDSIEAIKEPTIDTIPLDVPKKRAGTPTRVTKASVDSIEAIKEPIINTIPLDVPKKRAGTPTRVTRASVDSIEAIKESPSDTIDVTKKRAVTPTRVTRASVDSIEAIKEPHSDADSIKSNEQLATPKSKRPTTPTRITRSASKKEKLEVIQEDVNSDDDRSSIDSKDSTKRKSQRRTISSKPNLSVISEKSILETSTGSQIENLEKYSLQRRLTRHQKSILERSLASSSPLVSELSERDSETESIASDSPRPRRQSFTKAIEALHTPKKHRRASTDSKADDNMSVASSSENKSVSDKDAQPTSSKSPAVVENTEVNEKPKPSKRRQNTRKAASVHGDIVSEELPESPVPSKRRYTKIVTPLSKKEKLQVEEEDDKTATITRYRGRRTTSKISQPIKFIVKK